MTSRHVLLEPCADCGHALSRHGTLTKNGSKCIGDWLKGRRERCDCMEFRSAHTTGDADG